MKKNILCFILSLLTLIITGCSEDADSDMVHDIDKTRINIYPSELIFNADGTTQEGQNELIVIITVNPYKKKDHKWQASVDDDSWITIEQIAFDSNGSTERGLKIKAKPNENYKRKTNLIIRLEDGTEQQFEISQFGEKADAYVHIINDIIQLEFMADEVQSQFFSFITNMNSYFIEVENGIDWINIRELGNNTIEVTPIENTAENASEREAKIYIHVGTPETSEAVAIITVKQFAPELYIFIWGTSLPDYNNEAKAVKMEKIDENIFKLNAYFCNGVVRIGHYANTERYPQYYLMENGQVGVINSQNSDNGYIKIPSIDIEGMRSLVINLSTMQYSLERIVTQNSMPDYVLAEYPTKRYIARDGTMKEWIVTSIRWDGGNIVPKLGGKLVPLAQSPSGGYNSTADLPQSIFDPRLNPEFEEAENGGLLQGDDSHGRIYTYSEMLTGVARGGIDGAINQTFPVGWQAGDKIVDAVGNEIVIDYVTDAMITGDNKIDEKNNPTLTWQLQGICPYGYHIANAQDWLDLAYAMSIASQGDTYPVNGGEITYKQFMSQAGITNMAAWLRNTTYWQDAPIADGADDFGFNYYPTGYRYLKQGWQMNGLRHQVWVPLLYNDKKAYRINVVINKNIQTNVDMRNIDNGNAILPFRCVRNYKHETD